MLPDIRQPHKRTPWREETRKARYEAHMLRRELAQARRERDEVPKYLRVLCRIVGRIVRGRGA